MPAKKETESTSAQRRQPATTPEAREQQMIALAVEVAEEQMLARTASSQVITHYLKMGSSRELKEQAKLQHEILSLEVKIKEIESRTNGEALVKRVLSAMREYSGVDDDDDE